MEKKIKLTYLVNTLTMLAWGDLHGTGGAFNVRLGSATPLKPEEVAFIKATFDTTHMREVTRQELCDLIEEDYEARCTWA